MISILLDTHVLIWALREVSKLSATAKSVLRTVDTRWTISAITLVEMRYLIERHRIPGGLWDGTFDLIRHDPSRLIVLPVDLGITEVVGRIPRDLVPDMPDRIIAAAGLVHGLPLVTCDAKIQSVPGLTLLW